MKWDPRSEKSVERREGWSLQEALHDAQDNQPGRAAPLDDERREERENRRRQDADAQRMFAAVALRKDTAGYMSDSLEIETP